MNIQWYPGHMAKTKRILRENISLVDIIIELLDARIPFSSKNPDIDALAAAKRRIIVLNKADLAEAAATEQWADFFKARGYTVCAADSRGGRGLKQIISAAQEQMADKKEKNKARGRIFIPIRAMIVGIPNVGKSTLINSFVKSNPAKTSDRPGVTRGRQWIRLRKDFELLDTPGILWPRFDNNDVGLRLAFTGAITDRILDTYNLSLDLIKLLVTIKPRALTERYGVTIPAEISAGQAGAVLENICVNRGFLMKGGVPDLQRGAVNIIDEFRGGKLGAVSLEFPGSEAVHPMESR